MGSANRRNLLSEQIAEILGTRDSTVNTGSRNGARPTIRKSIAYGSMMLLAINPAYVGAVGLGEIQLQSQLGQPLEAIVPLNLREGESLPKNCVQPAPAAGSLRAPPNLRVTAPARNGPGTYNVRVTTTNPLHEPMYEVSLMIKCPGMALLVRQYVLMLDLPGMSFSATDTTRNTALPAPVRSSVAPSRSNESRRTTPRYDAAPSARVTTRANRALPRRDDQIAAGSQYRVSHGDTLSTIARRVAGRLPNTIWQVSDRIFAENPHAFIRSNQNMIKLGSLIQVPAEAELTAMMPSARQSSTRQPTAVVSAAPSRRALPTRKPVTVTRQETTSARRTPNTTTQRQSNRWPTPGSVEANATVNDVPVQTTQTPATSQSQPLVSAQVEPTPVAVPEPVTAPEPTSPFVDEVTAPVADNSSTVDNSAAAESGTSNLWLSVLLGLLLGAMLSLLVFRRRIAEALGRGQQRKPIAIPVARVAQPDLNENSTFDGSMAAAAFDSSSAGAAAGGSLPISGPLEDTYIVETAVGEPTIREEAVNLRADVAEGDTNEQPPRKVDPASTVDDDDSAELASMFEDDYATGGGSAANPTINEPTAEMPLQVESTLDPTAEMPIQAPSELDATAELPQQAGDEFFDPTAEIPDAAMEDIFDPTGGVDAGQGGDIESTLMQAFNEDLENFDADEMFATANHGVDDLKGESAGNPLEITINDPLDDAFGDDPTVATDVTNLPNNVDEDEDLSETLQEALNLLERDFEDEFTASQILERSALEKSLKEDLEQQQAEDADDDAKRKIS